MPETDRILQHRCSKTGMEDRPEERDEVRTEMPVVSGMQSGQ